MVFLMHDITMHELLSFMPACFMNFKTLLDYPNLHDNSSKKILKYSMTKSKMEIQNSAKHSTSYLRKEL